MKTPGAAFRRTPRQQEVAALVRLADELLACVTDPARCKSCYSAEEFHVLVGLSYTSLWLQCEDGVDFTLEKQVLQILYEHPESVLEDGLFVLPPGETSPFEAVAQIVTGIAHDIRMAAEVSH